MPGPVRRSCLLDAPCRSDALAKASQALRSLAQQSTDTTIWLRNEKVRLPSLSMNTNVSSAVYGSLDAVLTPTQFLDSNFSHPTPLPVWGRVVHLARRRGELHIVVLGASPTAGAGANGNSNRLEGGAASFPGLSWARRLHDGLGLVLRTSLNVSLRTHIFYKNAVDPSFFSWCTSRMIPHQALIVLYEVASSTHEMDGLQRMVTAGQLVVPRAAHVLVYWPSWTGVRSTSRRVHSEIAGMFGTDVLWGDEVVANITGRRERRGQDGFYYDEVHPNAHGHRLLGAAAMHLLSLRLHVASQCCASLPLTSHGEQVSAVAIPESKEEACFTSADQLPVSFPSGSKWDLRDEGGHSGIKKWGFVSEARGDKMILRLPEPTSAACAGRVVGLGYLASTRLFMGNLRLSCTGCSCFYINGFFTNRFAFPFPEVATSINYERFGAGFNASVTDMTSFTVMQNASVPCDLHILHAKRSGPQSKSGSGYSRVRVDSLFIRPADKGDIRTALGRGKGHRKEHDDFAHFAETCQQSRKGGG